jgi:hypothetical protein
MDKKARELLNEEGGLSFDDNDLPSDPMDEHTEIVSKSEIDSVAKKILTYIKERGAEGYYVYRKEIEMITQNTDTMIDDAIKKLKSDGEIYEQDKNEFGIALKSKDNKSNVQEREIEKTPRIRTKGKGNENDNNNENKENKEGKSENDGEIYDLTEDDMPTQIFDGERIGIGDILGDRIIIRDMATRPSSFSEGDYVILQIEKDNKTYVVLTGSAVLTRQIKEKADRMPFRCKIIEQQSTKSKYKYYTLAPAVKSKQLFVDADER